MFCLTSVSMFLKRTLRWPPAMISYAGTVGTPAAIMVAIWRLKMATSRGFTVEPAAPNRGFGFSLTAWGFMPWRRSSALTRLALRDCISPFIFTPRLSSATHSYTVNCLTAARAAPTLPADLDATVAVAIYVFPETQDPCSLPLSLRDRVARSAGWGFGHAKRTYFAVPSPQPSPGGRGEQNISPS